MEIILLSVDGKFNTMKKPLNFGGNFTLEKLAKLYHWIVSEKPQYISRAYILLHLWFWTGRSVQQQVGQWLGGGGEGVQLIRWALKTQACCELIIIMLILLKWTGIITSPEPNRNVSSRVAEPSLFWAAPALEVRSPGADSSSDQIVSAPAQSKKKAAPGGSGSIH